MSDTGGGSVSGLEPSRPSAAADRAAWKAWINKGTFRDALQAAYAIDHPSPGGDEVEAEPNEQAIAAALRMVQAAFPAAEEIEAVAREMRLHRPNRRVGGVDYCTVAAERLKGWADRLSQSEGER